MFSFVECLNLVEIYGYCCFYGVLFSNFMINIGSFLCLVLWVFEIN